MTGSCDWCYVFLDADGDEMRRRISDKLNIWFDFVISGEIESAILGLLFESRTLILPFLACSAIEAVDNMFQTLSCRRALRDSVLLESRLVYV